MGYVTATGRARAIAASLAVAATMVWGSASGVELARTDTAAPVAADALLAALSVSGVSARLQPGESLALLDETLTAGADGAHVYLAASSEHMIAATLRGATSLSDGEGVEAGEVAVMAIPSRQSRVSAFDIDRFLASSSYGYPDDVEASLAAAAERQRRLLYWGALRRTAFNAQAPARPALEAVRRDQLSHPTVIALRAEAEGDAERLAGLVVERFVDGLRRGDREAVRSLLAPALFSPDQVAPSAWLRRRDRFAGALLHSPLRRAMATARLEGGDLKEGFVAIAGDGTRYRIRLAWAESMLFVSTIGEES